MANRKIEYDFMIQSMEISFKFSEELRARINQKHLAIDYKLEKNK